jgi:hypothetical protein
MYEMEFWLAQKLVFEAVRIVLAAYSDLDPPLTVNDNLTLEEIGLASHEHRDNFRTVLVERIRQEGYKIDPTNIPRARHDTVLTVAMALPGHSTKTEDP